MLTAKICQLYPYESPARLLERFFRLYGTEWNWDEWYVRIIAPKEGDNTPIKKRFMHVMTPAWPQMNSTYNPSFSTRETILEKMREAHFRIVQLLTQHPDPYSIMKTPEAKMAWLDVFGKFNFFESYPSFLEMNILCNGNYDEYLKWSGFVEAKFRILGEKLEEQLQLYNFKIHLWPGEFKREHPPVAGFAYCTSMYVGFKLYQDYEESIDLNLPVARFTEYVDNEWKKSY